MVSPMRTMPARGAPMPAAPVTKPVVTAKFGSPVMGLGHRILLYGPGGIGKTSMSVKAPEPVAFIDLDESLGKLGLTDVSVLEGISKWADLRSLLQGGGWDKFKTIVLDTGTRAEEMAIEHVLLTIKSEKGMTCSSIEDYGYGKGYTHLFEVFMGLLGDLDRHARAGRNVIIICHDCVSMVPNPSGEDWQRWEPRLHNPASGKFSIRLRMKEWCDHVLFMGYDVVAKDGKGKGQGSRTLWPRELPHCMAKSRTAQYPMPVGGVDDGETLWSEIIK